MIKVILFLLSARSLLALEPLHYSDKKIEQIAYGQPWLKLLHYKKVGKSKFESLLDGSSFFLAKDGKSNPISELKENLQAFHNNQLSIGREKQHPQCAFPLRYQFLKNQLKLKIPPVPCKKLDQFIKKFNQKKIFLVFSTAYPNNPGSMFGHTFLRIGTSKQNASFLLDYGLSYAAFVPPNAGGIHFAIKGVFGGYRGLFSVLPYYVKLNEYNNIESRDVWEYQLSLTPKEIKNLLLHVWEIETNSYFDYYFFSENCAYHILSLLEVVRPRLNLTNYFLYMTPADSVKKVAAVPKLVKAIYFRPSLFRRVLKQYSTLNLKQKSLFDRLVQGKKIATTSDNRALDSAITYLNYRKQTKEFNDKNQKTLSQLLLKRSQLPKTEQKTLLDQFQVSNRPDIGHDPHLLEFKTGKTQRSSFQELRYQTAYHDLLANDKGYEPFSEIVFPSITLRHQHSRWFLEKINFISLTSLNPWNRINRKLSWSLKFHLFQNRSSPYCQLKPCPIGNFYTGSGIASYLFSQSSLISAMALINIEAGKKVDKGYNWGPKLLILFLTNPLEWYKSKVSYSKLYKFHNFEKLPTKNIFEWSHSFTMSRNSEFRTAFSKIKEKKSFNQIKFSLLYYFM